MWDWITRKISIQLFPKNKYYPFFRCECNPSKMGPGGLKFLKEIIAKLFKNPDHLIDWDTLAHRKKAIKRIDIAVDILGVAACDVEGTYLKKPNTKRHVYLGNDGLVETSYFILSKHNDAEAYLYDKNKEENEDKDAEDEDNIEMDSPSFGTPDNLFPVLRTRFEYRVRKTERPIADLGKLTNHLKKFNFRAMDDYLVKNPQSDMNFTDAIFMRFALMSNKKTATDMVPEHLRADYCKMYEDAMVGFWNPEKIWAEGWKEELKFLGIIE